MTAHPHYFFVYRLHGSLTFDGRLPDGGLVVPGPEFCLTVQQETNLVARAFRLAERRFPCHPHEYLAVIEVRNAEQRRQAWLMQADWLRALREFRELMEVGK